MHLSGELVEIRDGPARAAVTTVGATLCAYSVGERRVLDGFDVDEVCPDARGQVLMPWPNRIASGRYEFCGRRLQLPVDELDRGNAIHGLVRWEEWQVAERARDAVRLRHRLAARPGYPFPLELSVEYRLSPSGLAVQLAASNLGAVPCPFGMGSHPYFVFSSGGVDAIELSLPAAFVLEADERGIPTRRAPVAGALDFRRGRVIGDASLDHAFARLDRDSGGLAHVVLRRGREIIRLWLDHRFDFVQVYTGDTLPDCARRRTSLAVEPMSCSPDAFNGRDGLLALDPGERLEGRWGIATE